MTTKPDGWVHKDWRTSVHGEGHAILACVHEWKQYGFDVPVCLVPPALLDAIDEVQEAFDKYFDCVEREDKTEEEYLKMKLDKLKEVRGESR